MAKETIDKDLSKLAISVNSIKLKQERAQCDIQTQEDPSELYEDDEEVGACTQLVDYGRLIVCNNLNNNKRLGMTGGKPNPVTDAETSFLVKGENFTVGRDEECSLVLKSSFVKERVLSRLSRVHFAITKNIKEWQTSPACIVDKSRNGTWINGKLIGYEKTRILQNKDKIAVFNPKFILFEYRETYSRQIDMPTLVTNKYFVQNKLGSGAFGEVFKVLSIHNVNSFALKHIKITNMTYHKKIKDESLNEAGIMRSLNHPCIVRLLDIMLGDKFSTTLVMEFMAGGDLLHRITGSENGYLSETTSQCFFYQILSALQYLHSKKISHRDIKPDNVLLKDDTEHTIVKLSDFGLSKFVGNDTALKSLIGTPNYVAPEVLNCRQLGSYSEKVDVWSVGVLLFACLSGTLPFAEEYGGTIENQIRKAQYHFLADCWKTVSKAAKTLIARMLTVDPDMRITVQELMNSSWLSKNLPIIQETDRKMNKEREDNATERDIENQESENETEKENDEREKVAVPTKRRKVE